MYLFETGLGQPHGGPRTKEPPPRRQPPPLCAAVDQFSAGSSQLEDLQKRQINHWANHFLRLINGDVEKIRKEKVTEVSLNLYVEGHLDKKTDPPEGTYGTVGPLDIERAVNVRDEMFAQMSNLRSKMGKLRLLKWTMSSTYGKPGRDDLQTKPNVEFQKKR